MLLIVAGTQDRHAAGGQPALQSLARAPVELLVVEGAEHDNIHQYPAYIDGLADRMAKVAGPS